jgi:signal transduction histidine kinase
MAYNQFSQIRKFMKKVEFNSDDQSTAFSHDQSDLNDIFREILPIIFHKLKNKLTPIIGYTQILKARTSDDFIMERLGKIENNADELTSLLNILKDYFKVSPTPKRPGNINRIVRELKPRWRETAAKNKIDLVFALAPDILPMPLHPGQIRLLLLNLVANAVTALQMKTSPPKELSLTTRMEDGRAKLTVRDNGIGMEQDDVDTIWAPFYAKFKNGAGLGLVICEKVIANHDAACRVRSRCGEFTEFEIIFPLPGNEIKKQNIKEDA